MKMARRPGVLRMISPPRAFSAGYGSFGDGAGWAGPSLTMRYLRTSKLNVRNRSGGSCPRRLVKPRGKPPADIVKKLACRRNKSWEIQFAHSSCSFPGRDNARLTAALGPSLPRSDTVGFLGMELFFRWPVLQLCRRPGECSRSLAKIERPKGDDRSEVESKKGRDTNRRDAWP